MSTVLFFSSPADGNINPTLGVVNELVNRDEKVIYYANDAYRDVIMSTGAVFKSYGNAYPNEVYFVEEKKKFDFLEFLHAAAENALNTTSKICDGLLKEVGQYKPDYIIHDSYTFWGKQIACKLSIPAVCSIANYALSSSIIEKYPERIINELFGASENLNSYKLGKWMEKVSSFIKNKYNSLDFNPDLFDFLLCEQELNILYTVRDLNIYEDVFDNRFKFVGCSFYSQEGIDFPYEKLDCTIPLIYISMGTVLNNKADFYNKCFRAFENMSCQVVLSIGNKVEHTLLGKIPANFIVCRYAPQLEILKRARLFITHGGYNSINESTFFEVPMLVFPQGNEQFLSAKTVERLGIGVELHCDEITPEELRSCACEILSDKSYYDRIAPISCKLKASGGYKKAVDEIFAFKIDKGIRK